MRGLGKVVTRMTKFRRSIDANNSKDEGRLEDVAGFGTNPGELNCRVYLPNNKPTALVVVLHGCTQTASSYDHGSGWSKLAEQHGFAVLFPEQRRTNNPNLCFNWYVPSDARRNCGEAKSISQMVQHIAGRLGLDRSRTFVNGLSAGGAMTAVMLACYPELFAGGAIIAGLPFGSASTLQDALERMRGQGFPARQQLAARARAAASFEGSPPRLAVWHGTADMIVDPANATAVVDQWRDLHGLGLVNSQIEAVSGHRREVWADRDGRAVIERYDVRGMGHGTPLDARKTDACGSVGAHMLDAGICSTRHIAASWGLTPQSSQSQALHAASQTDAEQPRAATASRGSDIAEFAQRPGADVRSIIEDALRSAGLLR